MTEVVQAPARPSTMSAVGAALRETRDSIASVFANPGLRRIQLALAGSMIGDWAYATAATVWAYGVGGATAVGVWTAIRLTLMATTAPVASVLADRFPRKKVMIGADLARVVLVGLAAACLYADAPAGFIFVLATLTSLLGTPFRASLRSLTPALADRPEELTASNGTSSTIESLSFFVGPALGASLIGLTDVATVFVLNALTFAWSMLMVFGITVPHRGEDAPTPPEPGEPSEEKPSFLTETLAGFRTIFGNRDLAVTIGEVSAQTIVAGASAVFGVVIAVDILGSGAKGVGYLDAVLGIGAIVGGLLAISRAGKRRLGQDMTVGVVLWSIPLLLITIAPHPVAAFAAMALLGLANPLVDVNMDTIVQRITPEEVMGRVFGAVETCLIGTMALGSIAMPVLLHLVGLRTSLAVIGVAVALLAVAGLPRMLSMDKRLGIPEGLPLLQAIPMFAPLTPATVESLARALVRVQVPTGQVVLHEGDDSDRFYIIESGRVQVTQGERVLREEGPGEFFGEIGLLRDVPRTATITALDDVVLQSLDRTSFVDAVTGQHDAAMAADDIVARRLTF